MTPLKKRSNQSSTKNLMRRELKAKQKMERLKTTLNCQNLMRRELKVTAKAVTVAMKMKKNLMRRELKDLARSKDELREIRKNLMRRELKARPEQGLDVRVGL